MFSIGEMENKFIDAYKVCQEIHDAVLEETRPGADCEAIFQHTLQLAKKLGYNNSYLGPPGLQTRFIGHGIGLELNEFPFLAQGHSYPLEEGMTFAVEPKIVFPGEGSVGLENTVVVTQDGYDILTPLACPCALTSRYSLWTRANPGNDRTTPSASCSAMPISLIK
jgi:Xaa-Pro aminopeptidase